MRDEKRTQIFDRSAYSHREMEPEEKKEKRPPSRRGQYKSRDLTPARTGIGYETR